MHATEHHRLAFPLLADVVALADVAAQRADAICVPMLADGLHAILSGGGQVLPPELYIPGEGAYARRLLFESPSRGYQVLAMTWGPRQGTAVHDHGGTWGVEAVLQGELELTEYGRPRGPWDQAQPLRRRHLGEGHVAGLLPPEDVHACVNPSRRHVAVSLHVYGASLEHSRHYPSPGQEGYRRRLLRPLATG